MYKFVDLTEVGTRRTSTSIETIFNSMNLDDILTDEQGSFRTLTVSGRNNRTNRINTTEIPGEDGLFETRNATMSEKEIVVKYQISDQTNAGFQDRCTRLNELLTGQEQALTFTDDNKTFYATLSVNELPEENSNTLVGTLTFLCSDPHKYGSEQTQTFSDGHVLTNEGNAETSPIFRATAKQSATFLDIVKENGEYMRIGSPARAEQTGYSRTTSILHATGSSLTGWTEATSVDNGVVTGTMATDNDGFIAGDFGAEEANVTWQGPSMKTSLSEPLTDFQLTARIENMNLSNQTGMIEIYLLDASNNVVAKIGLEDVWQSTQKNQVKMQLGNLGSPNEIDYYRQPDIWTGWNNFDGMIRLVRRGNTFAFYVAEIDANGNHDARDYHEYPDYGNYHTADVTQVQVAIRKFTNTTPTAMTVKDVKVDRYNDQSIGIPYIAESGDVIEVDHKKAVIRINGEERNDLKYDFGSDYFDLDPGINTVYTFPEGAYDTTITWRDAYK